MSNKNDQTQAPPSSAESSEKTAQPVSNAPGLKPAVVETPIRVG